MRTSRHFAKAQSPQLSHTGTIRGISGILRSSSMGVERMAKRDAVVIDQGPPERRQHNKVVIERTANHKARLRIVDQTELDRLLVKRLISLDQHTAGEHLYRDIQSCGYMPACKWALDSNIRGAPQSVSQHRADALVKIGLARMWLLAKAGRRTTEFLFGVILGERKVPDQQLPFVRSGLDAYQDFEGWWYGRSAQEPLPELLADLPGTIKRTLPLQHKP